MVVGDTACTTVSAVSDSLFEEDEEHFIISISAVNEDISIATPTATIIVVDIDGRLL